MFKSEIGEGCNLWPNYGIVNPQIIIDIFDTINLTSEDTIHIILDTLTQLNKISSTYAPLIAELGSKHILHIFTLFNGDKLIGKLTVQLISQLSAHKEAFQKIYVEFSPFLLECFSVFQNHLEVTSDLSTLKPSDIQLMTVRHPFYRVPPLLKKIDFLRDEFFHNLRPSLLTPLHHSEYL